MLYRLDGEPGARRRHPAWRRSGASYFEIVSLAEVQSTLRSVGIALVGATAITTSLGLLLGSLAARRAVRPLGDAAQAAKAIAGGRLDTRLEPTEDRDLAAAGQRPSTTWPPPCSSGSSATPASPPT